MRKDRGSGHESTTERQNDEARNVHVSRAVILGTMAAVIATGPAIGLAQGARSTADARAELLPRVRQFLAVEPLDPFTRELPLDEAYRWQDVFVELLAETHGDVAGYKTGGHDPGPANPYFPPGGIRGTLLEGMIEPSGTAIRPEETVWGFLEADLAVRVRDDAINAASTDLEILAGLDAVVPFLEIPDPAFRDDRRSATGSIVTNMASRYAFVGEPVPLETTEDWLHRIRTFTFAVHDEQGNEIGAGSIADWYDPIAVVRWLRDQLRASGKRLSAGQLLSLGNIGITSPLKTGSPRGGPAYAGTRFTLSYDGLSDAGPATVTIAIDR